MCGVCIHTYTHIITRGHIHKRDRFGFFTFSTFFVLSVWFNVISDISLATLNIFFIDA